MSRGRIGELLARFEARCDPGPYSGRCIHHRDGGAHDLHVAFGVLTHGDEVGPLPAALGLIEDLDAGRLAFGGRLTIIAGNPEAALAGRRFLEADLNRVFTEGPDSLERRRARELMPALDDCDLFIDLHQTAGPSLGAFWTLPWSTPAWRWIRVAGGGRLWVTRAPGLGFASGTRCGDEYVRRRGVPGLTLELGERGLSREASAAAAAVMRRVLAAADAIAGGASLAELAAAREDLRFLITAHKEPFGDPARRLLPGLANFQEVRAGQRLSGGGPELIAPLSGHLLFPKYPPRGPDGRAVPPVPADLFRLLRPPAAHPLELFGDAGVS